MGGEELNGVSWHTANKDLILVHTVKLKPIIKAQISEKLVTSGSSDRFSILQENPSEEVDYDN